MSHGPSGLGGGVGRAACAGAPAAPISVSAIAKPAARVLPRMRRTGDLNMFDTEPAVFRKPRRPNSRWPEELTASEELTALPPASEELTALPPRRGTNHLIGVESDARDRHGLLVRPAATCHGYCRPHVSAPAPRQPRGGSLSGLTERTGCCSGLHGGPDGRVTRLSPNGPSLTQL